MTGLASRIAGLLMIAAGIATFAAFGGGLVSVVAHQATALMQKRAEVGGLMTTLLVAPIVGVAPALLGLVLARNGWRRLRSPTEAGDEP